MMESCLNYKPERVGSVPVEDLRKDLSAEFSKISESRDSLGKEHLRVYLRVRPFTAAERAERLTQGCVSVDPPDGVSLTAPRASLTARHSDRPGAHLTQRFQFSRVYGPETTQRQIFDGTTKCLVKDVLEGGNSLIFTYGVTNAGKTFTFLGPESNGGILPRSLNVIFNTIEDRIYLQNNIKPLRCVDFTRLTKEQQEEEATNKRNLLRRFKDTDSQKTTSSLSSSSSSLESSTSSDMSADSVSLDEDSYVKFSVWVSFCEIYNEYVHDLLDFVPNGNSRRSVLRLAQDVKGNTFVKDLKWVQVNSADEAFKVVKIGRKNQTFSSTKLNNISSRSHSIFSIRILRIEDVGVPRVHTISELSLCDLAGSERCAKTQNSGDRLKEAGNINTSLLTLGKCINALRLNQTQSKFHQHIPFRESKLTHYLQGFFSGHGKVCMIININQCASMYDETLNVLRFSAVAQKVVVLNPKPAPSLVLKRSARDVSMIINNADRKDWTRRSSLMGWDMSLEDVQEDKDDEETSEEEVESEEEESMEEDTVLEAAESQELQVEIEELKEKLSKAESQIREEVTAEFMELFSNMEKDYNERLQREKEIVEERAERRLDILKNLVNKTVGELTAVSADESAAKEATIEVLDNMIEAMREDLAKIKGDAEAVQMCLTSVPDPLGTVNHLKAQLEETTEELHKSQELFNLKTKEMEAVHAQLQESHDQLLEANKNYENQKVRSQDLMLICQEKDDMISKLQTALDQNVEATTKDRALIDTIKEEILHFRNHCKCVLNDDSVLAGEEMRAQEIQQLQQDLKMKEDQLNELKLEKSSLEKKMCDLADRLAEQTRTHDAAVSTLETERSEVTRVTNENKALAGELHLLQQAADDMSSKLRTIQKELSLQTKMTSEISEELDAAKSLIKEHQTESSAQSKTIESLMAEADRLKMKEDQLNELKLEKSSLEKKMCDLADRLAEQTRTHDAAVSSLETERSEVTRVTNENKALADELHLLQQTADNTSSKLRTIQKELSLQTKMTSEISEELDAAKSLIKEHQTESSAQSKTIESLMAEADRLRQDLNSNQLSYDRAEALRLECERMEEESQDKSRQIDELEQEVSQTRAKMSQLEELSNQLRSERDAQIQAYQALQSRYEAENLAEAQRRNSELLKELTALMQQQGRLKEQEQDSRDDCWITLKEQLMQTMRKLNQQEEVLNVVRVIVENEISKVRDEAQKKVNEMEKDLAHKDAELENKAQELLKSRELVNDGLNKIKTMSCDLQQVERERSNLRNQLSEAKVQIEHSQKQILSLSEENKLLQQRLCRAEEMRDQTMHSLSCKQETIDPLQTWQSNYAREENIQLCQKACQDLSAKQMLIEEMRVNATKKESTQTDREQLVGAGPNERASINEDPAKLQGMQRNGRADDQRQQVEQRPCKPAESTKRANEELASDKQEREQGEGLVGAAGREAREAEAAERLQGGHHDRLQLELETLQKQLAEKQDTILNLQREKDELASSIKSAIQREEDRLQASDVKMNNEGDSSCPTQEDVTILDSSVISTKSLRDERFPKPELEISFTPLKPDRMNIRRPGDQGSVTVKLRRTARKRKSPETENSAESENRKNRRLKVNNSINVQPVETPTVQNKRVSQLKQQESAGSLRGRRDGALQKIGDFIQSSPTLFGSKAKKIMSIVNSPEPQSIYENIKPKRSKRKLFKAQISSPFDMPSHPIIGSVEDDKESDHLIIKRKLRTRTAKIIQHF